MHSSQNLGLSFYFQDCSWLKLSFFFEGLIEAELWTYQTVVLLLPSTLLSYWRYECLPSYSVYLPVFQCRVTSSKWYFVVSWIKYNYPRFFAVVFSIITIMEKILVGSSIVVVRIFGLKLSRTSLNNCRPTPLRVWFLCNFVVNWIHLGSWFFNFGDFLTQCGKFEEPVSKQCHKA